ncbi:MAG TPA: hypothetical protein GXX28_04605, partial [Firmicutes bacterium]|nr:hypothetical protein [Bacillota bacterium]
EAAWDAHLRGASPESWIARLQALGFRRSRPGLPDLRTTIRGGVQRAAEEAMAGRRGAVVALDPQTGAVLALVSVPGFRPDRVDEEWKSLRTRPDSPLLNRAVAGLYPPGSAFKPVVVLAALEAGAVRRDEVFVCRGRRTVRGQTISDFGGAVHGQLDLAQALAVSCNYVFSGLAMRLSPEGLARRTAAWGLWEPAGLGLAEARGRFPELPAGDRTALAEVGIGQGSLLVTPFALARFAALLATGGRMVEPYLVEGLAVPGGPEVRLAPFPGPRPAAAAPGAVAAVNRLLAEAVARGTGWRASVAGVRVAGKTGSAENPHGPAHAWFMGFAPAEAPRVAVAVVVENGGLGGRVAAPVARRVIEAALEH